MFARLENGRVVEVILPPDGLSLDDMLHPDLAGLFVACPDHVQAGWVHENGEFAPPPAISVPDLSAFKAALKSQIDAAAEAERLKYITPGSGQAITYARKVEQAKAVLAAADPQPADYPMLAASIGIDGADIVAVANTVVAMDAAWEMIGAAIETTRLTAKQAVDLAETAADARAVEALWPSAD
jgi:hypothetical protein